ncbi:uncharacterized protein LOC143240086 isoform X2 [Tachypleus tridentatus]|uniref:uncharacterized protein LOC143240086 isoform X2 n=1 Tax=Tachypleus tridentatus TaxID=6853 RepID=UPI003FD0BEF6
MADKLEMEVESDAATNDEAEFKSKSTEEDAGNTKEEQENNELTEESVSVLEDENQWKKSMRLFHNGRFVQISHLSDDTEEKDIREFLCSLDIKDVEMNKATASAKVILEKPETFDPLIHTTEAPTMLNGKKVVVQFSNAENFLCVSNLPLTFGEKDFDQLVEKFGPVERSFLVYDHETDQSKGYGLVEYCSRAVACQAKSLLNLKQLDSEFLYCEWLDHKLITYSSLYSRCLFVTKLPADFRDLTSFRKFFSEVATPIYCQLSLRNEPSAKFGLVEFANQKDADETQKKFDGREHGGQKLRVSFGQPGFTAVKLFDKLVADMDSKSRNKSGLLPTPAFPAQVLHQLRMAAMKNAQAQVLKKLLPNNLMQMQPRPLQQQAGNRAPWPLRAPNFGLQNWISPVLPNTIRGPTQNPPNLQTSFTWNQNLQSQASSSGISTHTVRNMNPVAQKLVSAQSSVIRPQPPNLTNATPNHRVLLNTQLNPTTSIQRFRQPQVMVGNTSTSFQNSLAAVNNQMAQNLIQQKLQHSLNQQLLSARNGLAASSAATQQQQWNLLQNRELSSLMQNRAAGEPRPQAVNTFSSASNEILKNSNVARVDQSNAALLAQQLNQQQQLGLTGGARSITDRGMSVPNNPSNLQHLLVNLQAKNYFSGPSAPTSHPSLLNSVAGRSNTTLPGRGIGQSPTQSFQWRSPGNSLNTSSSGYLRPPFLNGIPHWSQLNSRKEIFDRVGSVRPHNYLMKMAYQGPAYGLSRECQIKSKKKFQLDQALQALDWVREVTNEKLEPPNPERGFEDQVDFADSLKDGIALCKLINILMPGAVPKINEGKMPFKQMENIEMFLKGCTKYGLKPHDLFQVNDLYERKNLYMAQKRGFDGPVIGVKLAEENRRNFSKEQLDMSKTVLSLQTGTNRGASQSGMTPYGATRQILPDRR